MLIQSSAFEPDPRTADTREDKCQETSINFEDGPGAIGEIQTRHNLKLVVRLPTRVLAHVTHHGHLAGYIRSKYDGNPYHGDILFHPDSKHPKWRIRQVAGMLAMEAVEVKAG